MKPAAADSSGASRRLLDVKAAAAYLGGVSVWTIRRYVADGRLLPVRLPSVRDADEPGRRLLFDIEDLDRFVDACKRESSPEPNAGLSAAASKGWRDVPVEERRTRRREKEAGNGY